MINVENLSKNFGKKQVLNGVNLEISEGKIYGLLGNNAQGKTTLLNIITNRLLKTDGIVESNGESAFENENIQQSMFLVSERAFDYERNKIKDFFKMTSWFYPNFDFEKAKILCEKFGVNPKEKIHKQSTGYKTIVKCVAALCSGAKILIFDEPVLGLDIVHREMFYKEMLRTFEETGCGIVISTHLIEEIEHLIEHLFILNDTKIIVDSDVEDLLCEYYNVTGAIDAVSEYIKDKEVVAKQEAMGKITALIRGEREEKDGLEFSSIQLHRLFIALTKGEL